MKIKFTDKELQILTNYETINRNIRLEANTNIIRTIKYLNAYTHEVLIFAQKIRYMIKKLRNPQMPLNKSANQKTLQNSKNKFPPNYIFYWLIYIQQMFPYSFSSKFSSPLQKVKIKTI